MTNEINDMEIQRMRTKLESERERKAEKDRESARTTLVDRLAQGNYDGILKSVFKYGIQIPQEHLLKAAKDVAIISIGRVIGVRGDYDELKLAKVIYRRLGLELEAKAVMEYIAKCDEVHERNEFDKTWR